MIPPEKQLVFRKIMQELSLAITGKIKIVYFRNLADDIIRENEEEIYRWLKRNQSLIMNL